MDTPSPFFRIFFLVQGGYYLVTALWPLFHMPSFVAVTGPKTDLWLVRTVGLLITVISLPLLAFSAWPQMGALPILLVLSAGACLALAAVDFYYVAKRVISPIYLADGILEIGLLAVLAVLVFLKI